ncbi:permease-like cell division protein FtsX [Sporosalibacterium faouarense]|uniref:permease-like cell division protein FtsX n=1 Tax=Sporosalibacterium faouarense TaxID=516123 RepID=UPI001FAF29C7|nr:permease-like cell division protein FtsX [Sporosalibacterium faouarense]
MDKLSEMNREVCTAMNFRNLSYMIKQGFVSMWKNRMMSFASVGSVTAALLILGVILLLILNINNIATVTQNQFDEVVVYLEEDVDQSDTERIGDAINEFDGILSVIYQSKEQALEIMKQNLGENGYLLEGLEEENPLPNSYVIQLKDLKYADDVVMRLEGLTGVEDIRYLKDVLDQLMTIANTVRLGGFIIIGFLILISIFIISNTIKLTVAARKREINIMKYVGATNGFIRGPFVVEGMLLGLIGAVISIAVVYFGYKYLFTVLNEELYVLFTVYLVPYYKIFQDITIIFVSIGVGIGVIGSVLSIRKFLKV